MKLYLVKYTDYGHMGEPDCVDEIFFDRNRAEAYLAAGYSSEQIVKQRAWIDTRETADDPRIEDYFQIVWRAEKSAWESENYKLKKELEEVKKQNE